MTGRERRASWFFWTCAAGMFLASGASVIGSTMAFKFNRPLTNGFVAPGPNRDNWVALPYKNLVPTYTAMCGSFPAGASKGNIVVSQINPCTGVITSFNCVIGSSTLLNPRLGVRVRVTGTTIPASPDNIVLVGSHDDATILPDLTCKFISPGPIGDYWLSIPYHGTWLYAEDVCKAYGLGVGEGSVAKQIGTAPSQHLCGLSSNNWSVGIAEAVRVRMFVVGPKFGVAPPHF